MMTAESSSCDDAAERIRKLDAVLEGTLGRPTIERRGRPLGVLIGTILSQSTSSINSRRAYESLTQRFPSWHDALDAGPQAIEDAIRAGGLARQKSERIHGILNAIHQERASLELDDLCELSDEEVFERLSRFKGVGTKTIAIVLMFSCMRDVCPVDTHVLRILRRLGVVSSSTAADRAYYEIQPCIPLGHGPSLHVNLIRFGRSRCTARSPKCEGCPLIEICRYDRETGSIQPERAG
jgi:endonuclease III